MRSTTRKATSAIALFLVFSVSQVYVYANLLAADASGKSAATATSMLAGKLSINGNKPIMVNGNSANSGTTILTGTQLHTPQAVAATVQLGALGVLDLAPETDLTLSFSDSKVNVTLTSGYATLTTNTGVNGSMTMPDGTTKVTDASNRTVAGGTANAQGGSTSSGGGSSNDSAARKVGLIIFAVLVAGGVIYAIRGRGNRPCVTNPSITIPCS